MKQIKTNCLHTGCAQDVWGLLRGMFLLLLLMMLMPAVAWADDELETIMVDGTSYYVLRNESDWLIFKELVQDAKGTKEVNAIMDTDFTVIYSIALDSSTPYCGTFNGNGHTLNLNINGGDIACIAPFSHVKNATFMNLHVTGTVSGGLHASGLIGSSDGTNYINNCWMSATVNSSSTHVGGFIGHGQKAKHVVDNCLFDGTLVSAKGGNDSHGGAFVGWEEGGTSNEVTHCLENGTYSNIKHAGMNYNKSVPWGGGSTNWSYHNWSEVNGNVVGSRTAADMVNLLGSRNWHVVDGKAIPVMSFSPNLEDITLETYDAVPGTEKGDEGTIRIPITCTSAMKYLDASYTDADGNMHTLSRITLDKDAYFCFLCLPATEKITNLTLTAKLVVGSITTTIEKVPMIHNPRMLKADVDSVGGVKLRWKALNRDVEDILDGDVFLVQRSLTGKMDDFEDLESDIMYDSKTEDYLYRDSTLISSLQAEHIDKNLGIPLVRYRVLRASTQDLWGMEKNPTVAYVQPQFATLVLLEPKSVSAAWSNFEERKVKATWNWKDNDASHNYVWDDRAEIKVVTKMFNKAGTLVDSLVNVLTEEQYRARELELTLPRSCVTYDMRFIVDGSKSPIGKGDGEIFTLIKSSEDYVAYRDNYNNNKLTSYQNAILAADVTSPTNSDMLGKDSHPFTHNFNGNGFTLTYENTWAGQWRGLIQHAADGAVLTNLRAAGRFYHNCQYGTSLVAHVMQGAMFIENCYSQMSIEPLSIYDSKTGGLVGLVGTSSDGKTSSLHISNSLFDGRLSGSGTWSGMVGWREDGSFAVVSNSYNSSSYVAANNHGNTTIMFSSGANPWWNLIEDCSYKTALGTVQGKQSNTAPDNWCWKDGKPAMKQVQFSTPVSGSVTEVKLPADKFYYENLGHIDKTSLKTRTLQSSVLLEWKLEGEDAVDYFEVWRRKENTKDSVCLVTQLSDMEYEDKTASPIYKYEYKVRGVTSCEGNHYDETEEVDGMCYQTASVEGHLRFLDGTGIPGKKVVTKVNNQEVSSTTDESGYFRLSNLPYVNSSETSYQLSVEGIMNQEPLTVSFGTAPGDNVVKNRVIEVKNSVKLSGYVTYEGTSIPVQGVSFKVDGYEVHSASGRVTTNHEGKFAFRILPGDHDSIQAVKDGHVFSRNGFYHKKDNDPDTQKAYNITIDNAEVKFYDKTRVKLIGRVVGGKTEGEKPLGNALSKNNLGDDLQMVFTLEGDNASRLVFDINDRKKTTRDEVNQGAYHHQPQGGHARPLYGRIRGAAATREVEDSADHRQGLPHAVPGRTGGRRARPHGLHHLAHRHP